MDESIFDDMPAAIGFGEADAKRVRSLAALITPAIPEIVDHFYDWLLKNEDARSVFDGGETQLERQRSLLSEWLHELLECRVGHRDGERRGRVGAAHAAAGLPQHYIFAGMELIWQELERRVRKAKVPALAQKLESLHKLMMVELAAMLERYKESYAEQVRRFERTAVEEKLTRAEHLAEIGQLAASLAHEIKNPLAGISGAIQIIRDAMAADDPHQPIVSEILGQIGRLDATVKDLLQYARPTPPKATKVTLDNVVTRVLTLLRKEPSLQRVRVKYEKRDRGAAVYADDTQIEQLLFNLILNAAHASEDGGVIHMGVTQNADHVRLYVKDEGRGMEPEVIERAFEPFFTTKARGTGLGLSICRRIVEVHGGRIRLESKIDEGTRVVVKLPLGGTGGGGKAKS
ncbi:MAG: ATP-binding protein [Phycisphaerae bacterium]